MSRILYSLRDRKTTVLLPMPLSGLSRFTHVKNAQLIKAVFHSAVFKLVLSESSYTKKNSAPRGIFRLMANSLNKPAADSDQRCLVIEVNRSVTSYSNYHAAIPQNPDKLRVLLCDSIVAPY